MAFGNPRTRNDFALQYRIKLIPTINLFIKRFKLTILFLVYLNIKKLPSPSEKLFFFLLPIFVQTPGTQNDKENQYNLQKWKKLQAAKTKTPKINRTYMISITFLPLRHGGNRKSVKLSERAAGIKTLNLQTITMGCWKKELKRKKEGGTPKIQKSHTWGCNH